MVRFRDRRTNRIKWYCPRDGGDVSPPVPHFPSVRVHTNVLACGDRKLDIAQPQVMGILNVTPDSFSDGGRFNAVEAALAHARQMVSDGATLIDVGGESTRPGAGPVSVEEELARVIPVIRAIRSALPVVISVDSSKPEVMRQAVAAGAGLINDVRALQVPGALAAAAESGVPVCLMHMQGEPGTMQVAPDYADVVEEVGRFLQARVASCTAAGISPANIILDPGFGFGKTLEHNLCLLHKLPALARWGFPLLVGLSRKSMVGAVLKLPVEQRLNGSIALAGLAVWLGASIIRAHDVRATVEAVRVCAAVRDADCVQG